MNSPDSRQVRVQDAGGCDTSAADVVDLHHVGDESHLVREIVRTYQVLMVGFSRCVGVPGSRLALMRALAGADGALGVMALARQLGINAAAVTRQVQEMDDEGLVRRRADRKDGRRTCVSLSAKGLRLFHEIHERSHELERELASVVSPDEMRRAAEVLAKLRTFVETKAK